MTGTRSFVWELVVDLEDSWFLAPTRPPCTQPQPRGRRLCQSCLLPLRTLAL